ncbi:hypothetical protein FIBSPDRAFT_876839 [Athelia psychrophila]|uniref:Uncharacterized protein n=1 Tax=Athelia psychrophila TaxID=1759441 RepID=A0A167WH11_9AGAM|nr:hypothetical protein FIBSPDRAFT_876839 [Fibularhizoctonia sp. CBS 109695]
MQLSKSTLFAALAFVAFAAAAPSTLEIRDTLDQCIGGGGDCSASGSVCCEDFACEETSDGTYQVCTLVHLSG